MPVHPKLGEDVEVDVIVVGAGITGITAAHLFKRAGKTVALVDRGRCAHVDTGHTTAHLTCVTDCRLYRIAGKFNETAAKAVWEAGAAAIDQIVQIVRKEDIACDFKWVPGYLHVPVDAKDDRSTRSELEKEAALANKFGIRADPLEEIPFFKVPGIRFAHQALFHPLKYLSGLLRKVPGDGSHVFENTDVEEITDEPLSIKSGGFTIRGKYIVLATHTPLTGNTSTMRAMLFQTKLALYTSYAVGARLPSGLIEEAAFWDTAEPYNYLRVDRHRGHDYAIFGGEDHKTGQEHDTEAAYHRLEKRLKHLIPEAEIDHRWSGQVIETNDGLPFIGETAPHQFAATGFAGNGMTFGTLSAMMAVDAMLKRQNPWQDIFEVHRAKLLGGTWEYLKENKDYPYHLVRDRLGGAEGKSLRELPRNCGKILNLDGKKVAAHRDGEGHVTLCSPVCTHLQCIVCWNDAEQTWDCPCHGSRFKPGGEVISGPAEEPLEKLPVPAAKS